MSRLPPVHSLFFVAPRARPTARPLALCLALSTLATGCSLAAAKKDEKSSPPPPTSTPKPADDNTKDDGKDDDKDDGKDDGDTPLKPGADVVVSFGDPNQTLLRPLKSIAEGSVDAYPAECTQDALKSGDIVRMGETFYFCAPGANRAFEVPYEQLEADQTRSLAVLKLGGLASPTAALPYILFDVIVTKDPDGLSSVKASITASHPLARDADDATQVQSTFSAFESEYMDADGSAEDKETRDNVLESYSGVSLIDGMKIHLSNTGPLGTYQVTLGGRTILVPFKAIADDALFSNSEFFLASGGTFTPSGDSVLMTPPSGEEPECPQSGVHPIRWVEGTDTKFRYCFGDSSFDGSFSTDVPESPEFAMGLYAAPDGKKAAFSVEGCNEFSGEISCTLTAETPTAFHFLSVSSDGGSVNYRGFTLSVTAAAGKLAALNVTVPGASTPTVVTAKRLVP